MELVIIVVLTLVPAPVVEFTTGVQSNTGYNVMVMFGGEKHARNRSHSPS